MEALTRLGWGWRPWAVVGGSRMAGPLAAAAAAAAAAFALLLFLFLFPEIKCPFFYFSKTFLLFLLLPSYCSLAKNTSNLLPRYPIGFYLRCLVKKIPFKDESRP